MGTACCCAVGGGGGTVLSHREIDWRLRREEAIRQGLLKHILLSSSSGHLHPTQDGYVPLELPTRWHFLAALHRQQHTHQHAMVAMRRRQQRIKAEEVKAEIRSSELNSIGGSTRDGGGKAVVFVEEEGSAIQGFDAGGRGEATGGGGDVDGSPIETWCYLIHHSQYTPVIADPGAPISSATVDINVVSADGALNSQKRRRSSSKSARRKSSVAASPNYSPPMSNLVSPHSPGDGIAGNATLNGSTNNAFQSANIANQGGGREYSIGSYGAQSSSAGTTMMMASALAVGSYLHLAQADAAAGNKRKQQGGAADANHTTTTNNHHTGTNSAGANSNSGARLLGYYDGAPMLADPSYWSTHHTQDNNNVDSTASLNLFAFSGGEFNELVAANNALVRCVSNELWLSSPLHHTVLTQPCPTSAAADTTDSHHHTNNPAMSDGSTATSKLASSNGLAAGMLLKHDKALLTSMSSLDLFLMHPVEYFASHHHHNAVNGIGRNQGPSRLPVGEVPGTALYINGLAMEVSSVRRRKAGGVGASPPQRQGATTATTRASALTRRERRGVASRSLLQRALDAATASPGSLGVGEVPPPPQLPRDLAESYFKVVTKRRPRRSSISVNTTTATADPIQQRGSSSSTIGIQSLLVHLSESEGATYTSPPPVMAFTPSGLAASPRHLLGPALAAHTLFTTLPTNALLNPFISRWLCGMYTTTATTPSSTLPALPLSTTPPAPLTTPPIADLGHVIQDRWRLAIGGGVGTSSTVTASRRQSLKMTTMPSLPTNRPPPLNANTEDMHVPDGDEEYPLPSGVGTSTTRRRSAGSIATATNTSARRVSSSSSAAIGPTLADTITHGGSMSVLAGVVSGMVKGRSSNYRRTTERQRQSLGVSADEEGSILSQRSPPSELGGGGGDGQQHLPWETPKSRRRRSLLTRPAIAVSPPYIQETPPPPSILGGSSSTTFDPPPPLEGSSFPAATTTLDGLGGVSLALQALVLR